MSAATAADDFLLCYIFITYSIIFPELVKKMSGCSEMWPNSNPDILSLYTVMAN
jgi:hypothetical protein